MLIMFREYISNDVSFLSSKDHHDKIWLKLEKSFFGCYLCSPESSTYTKSLAFDLLQELERIVVNIKQKVTFL